jgi:hypothetical protein
MARVDIGNPLTEPKLAPGWKLSDDGFGLRTCQATYNVDQTAGFDYIRGEAFPVTGYEYLKLHKQTAVYNKLGLEVQVCDYVGIDPETNGGVMTIPNTSSANGLTSENITAHPNFFTAASGYTGGPIAGLPADFGGAYDDSTLGPVVNRYNATLAKTVQVPSCEGYNGACFEHGTGGRFIGFVDPAHPTLFGKTQYLATTTTYSGVIYTNSLSYAQALLGLLNTATATNAWGVFTLLPAWAPVGTVTGVGHKNLLSQVNVEEYALLYKINYEIRYSKIGWNSKVYINI